MDDIEQLARSAAQVLGLQLSKGRESRYVGVVQQKATGKWCVRTVKGKTKSGSFDLEIQAALDVRTQQLDSGGRTEEAQELRQVQTALAEIAAELLQLPCCGAKGARCHCKEKALREAEAAKAALEAIRAALAAKDPKTEEATKVVQEDHIDVAPRAKTIDEYYRIETVRKQHQLDRRRAKESRRRLRQQQLRSTLQTHLETDPMAEGASADFNTLRRQFLQRVSVNRRRRARWDPERLAAGAQMLQRFGAGLRVIGFYDAARRLQALQEQKEARVRLQQSAETGAMVPMTPQGRNPDISVELEVDEPRRRPKRLRTPTDILLQRLVEKRRKEAEEAREAAGDEVKVVSMELDAVKDELAHMAESKAAKLEWLLLERLAPEPVLKNVQLGEEERAAQLEEERLQQLWELEGGAEEEERMAKEWRHIMRQRRQSFLARRGAQKVARKWLKRRGTGAGAVEDQPQPSEQPEVATADPYL